MKNYLARLNIPRRAGNLELTAALEHPARDLLDSHELEDAQWVLSNASARQHYERAHLQYEAIQAARHCLAHRRSVNTHRWQERLVEFESTGEEPLA